MSEQPLATTAVIGQGEALRTRIFSLIRRTSGIIVGLLLALFVALGLVYSSFPARYIVPATAIFLFMILLSEWLSRQKRQALATRVYVAALIAVLFFLVFFGEGVTGPMILPLLLVPAAAQLIGERHGTRWVIVIGVIYIVMMILDVQGVLKPRTMGETAKYWSYGLFFPVTLAAAALIVSVFIGESQRALATAQQHGQELAEATRQAQQAVQTAQQAAQTAQQLREHEARIARQLRQTVQEYAAFLERVTAGDYAAKLNLDETMAGEEGSKDLVTLGRQLTATVKSLVEALQGLETIQRRYVREAWTSFTASSTAHRGVQYRDAAVKLADDAWLAPMAQAVQTKNLTTRESELALPLMLRGQVIGAIGARWKEGKVWSQDDLALIEATTDQLAQTIEGLRLLDETQRRAAQEQLTGAITARMRESLDMERVLKTAADELFQALELDHIAIRLAPEETVSDEPPKGDEHVHLA